MYSINIRRSRGEKYYLVYSSSFREVVMEVCDRERLFEERW
jgi:hypothetical protein